MQDQELRYRIQQDRHSNQPGELLESLFEQRSAALRVDENAKNIGRSPGRASEIPARNAEEYGHCGLQNESEAAGASQALGRVFQKSAGKEIEAAMLIGVLQRKGDRRDQDQNPATRS
jgi:hypothetical protein